MSAKKKRRSGSLKNPALNTKNQLLKILSSIKDGVYITNKNCDIEYANQAIKKDFGPIKNRKCYAYLHDRKKRCPGCNFRKIESGAIIRSEWTSSVSGKVYDVIESLLRNTDGSVSKLKIIRDVSFYKNILKDLQLSEERYKLAQRAARVGSWYYDIRTGEVQWTEVIEPIFGFKKGEFKRTHSAFLERVHPDDRKYVKNSITDAIRRGEKYNIEHRIIWPDDTIKWVMEIGNVIKDKNGKPVHMIGTVQDITERKKARDILKRDKEMLERIIKERTDELIKAKEDLNNTSRLSDLGTLAATVAHELRNPLGVIKTAIFNISRKRKNPGVDKHLANIEKKIREGNRTINNLLSYSRIKVPKFVRVKIDDIINESVDAVGKNFFKYKISLKKNIKPLKGLIIEADSFQISEVLKNILTNAYQSFNDKKGRIIIKGEKAGRNKIRISVKDNGVGIDKDEMENIFSPFFTKKSKGTGLGLSIAVEFINLHGGEIKADSRKGKGTTITVSLPIRR